MSKNGIIKLHNMKTNWKYIIVILVLALLVGGTVLDYLKRVNEELFFISQFPEKKIENKETTLKKTGTGGQYNEFVYYDGEVIVSGKYQESRPGSLGGNLLCFYPDDETKHLIPRDVDLFGNPDVRKAWFCFDDQKEAKSSFGINDEEIFRDITAECIEGDATIKIYDYVVNLMQSEVVDTAKLKEIFTKEPYINQCE